MSTPSSIDMAGSPLPADAAPLRVWLAIAALAVGCFTFVSAEMMPIGVLGLIADDLQLSLGTVGLLVSGFAVVVASTAGPLTVLTGRIDRRTLMVSLMLLCMAGNALAAVATDFATLLVSRLIVAIAIGIFWSIATAMAVRLVPPHQAVRATSVVLGGLAVAAVAGVPAGTLIGQQVGWQTAFASLSLLSLVVAAAVLLLLPPMPARGSGSLMAIVQALRSPVMRRVLGVTALVMTGNFLAYTYVTPFLQDVAALPVAWMGPLLLLYGVAGVVGNFSAGAAMAGSIRSALIALIALLAVSLLLLWALGTIRFVAIALLVPWGLAYAALPVVLQTWIFQVAHEAGDAEAAISLFVAVFNGAIAAGALAGGILLDQRGPGALMLAAAGLVSAALLFVPARTAGRS